MRTTGLTAVLAVALLTGLTACSSAEPEPNPVPSPATITPHQAAKGYMPDVIGGSVAGAVGQITGGMLVEDVSGKGRIVPMNAPDWKICTQEPAPGAAIDGTRIHLGAVKKDEDC
ncbi:hypothetical protein ACIGEZ_25455 [Streptomyces sp. NPDC085481]|uniref:hypothetical protein n=1 Tax=Streptomyces sp. NPDC085481 TaxID=3365727 RepID=UPI0037CE93FB